MTTRAILTYDNVGPNTIGPMVKDIRQQAGQSQDELTEFHGYNRSTLSGWENKERSKIETSTGGTQRTLKNVVIYRLQCILGDVGST